VDGTRQHLHACAQHQQLQDGGPRSRLVERLNPPLSPPAARPTLGASERCSPSAAALLQNLDQRKRVPPRRSRVAHLIVTTPPTSSRFPWRELIGGQPRLCTRAQGPGPAPGSRKLGHRAPHRTGGPHRWAVLAPTIRSAGSRARGVGGASSPPSTPMIAGRAF